MDVQHFSIWIGQCMISDSKQLSKKDDRILFLCTTKETTGGVAAKTDVRIAQIKCSVIHVILRLTLADLLFKQALTVPQSRAKANLP